MDQTLLKELGEMRHHKYSEAHIIYDDKGSIGKLVADAEQADFVHLSLGINAEIEGHILDQSVNFYVISGCGTLYVDSSEIIVSTSDVIEVKAGATRGWKNDGDSVLEVLAVKHK